MFWWEEDNSMDGVVSVEYTDSKFIVGLKSYIANYKVAREKDVLIYMEHYVAFYDAYFFKRRWFGILPARKQKDEEVTLTEINAAVEKLTYHYTWKRYERLYRDRIAKANNLLSALQNQNKVFVDHDYYKLILEPKRETYIKIDDPRNLYFM